MRKTHVEKKHQGGRIALYVISMVLLLGVFSGLLYLRWEKPPEMIIAEADGPVQRSYGHSKIFNLHNSSY